MSRRMDLLNAIVSAISAILNPEGSPTTVSVAVFAGDESEFNHEQVVPSVWVEYTGRAKQPNETVGAMRQRASYKFSVFFSYASQVDAMTAMEAVDDGLPGALGDTGRLIEAEGMEALIDVTQSDYLYVQAYSVDWDA